MRTMNGFNKCDRLSGERRPCCRRVSRIWAGAVAIVAAVPMVVAFPAFAQPDGADDTAIDRVYADGPLAVRVSLDHTYVTTPGKVQLSFICTFEEGVEVQSPEFGQTLAGFLIVSNERTENQTLRNVTTFAVNVILESSLPGSSKLGPFEFHYRDARDAAADGRVRSVSTEPIEVQVVSGLADVTAPVELPIPLWRVIVRWAVLGAAGVGAIWLVVARVIPALQRRWTASAEPAPIAPELWALSELDVLAEAYSAKQVSPKDFYFRVNAILRRYIELRFGFRAGEQTSEEFLTAVQREATFKPEHRDLLDRFVRACDPVKYAAQRPSEEAVAWLEHAARVFVVETSEQASATADAPDFHNRGAAA